MLTDCNRLLTDIISYAKRTHSFTIFIYIFLFVYNQYLCGKYKPKFGIKRL